MPALSQNKERVLQMAALLGLFDAAMFATRNQVRVLTYHSVVDVDAKQFKRFPMVYRNAITAGRFEEQIAYLTDRFHLLDADEFTNYLNGATLPPRSVLLTFDDGLINNRTVAAPILKKYGAPAVFFLPTAFVDSAEEKSEKYHWTESLAAMIESLGSDSWQAQVKAALPTGWPTSVGSRTAFVQRLVHHLKQQDLDTREAQLQHFREQIDVAVEPSRFPADRAGHSILETMDWADAAALVDQGFAVGSHTVTHPILSGLNAEDVEHEMVVSRQIIQERLGVSCKLFSYPFGGKSAFNRKNEAAARRAGYGAAFTQIPGFADQRGNRMRISRLDVSPNHRLATFRYLISGLKHRLVDLLATHLRSD